jgi:hypothetical protein
MINVAKDILPFCDEVGGLVPTERDIIINQSLLKNGLKSMYFNRKCG